MNTSKYSSNEKFRMHRWLNHNAKEDGKQLAHFVETKDGIDKDT